MQGTQDMDACSRIGSGSGSSSSSSSGSSGSGSSGSSSGLLLLKAQTNFIAQVLL